MKTHKNIFSLSEKHTVNVFDSVGEFGDFIEANATEACKAFSDSGDFYSNSRYADVKRGMIEGDADCAKRSEKLMSKLETGLPMTNKRQRVSSPYGRANVGAYLASSPEPCRRYVKKPSDSAPVSIVVSLNSMAGVKASDLEKRGIVIAALVRKLVQYRPVNLYLSRFSTADSTSSAMLVRFPTAPIDSYRLAYLLSNQGFCRGMGFAYHCAIAKKHTSLIFFAGGNEYSQSRHCKYSRDLEKLFGHEVFYIPGSDPKNPDHKLMISDPVAWLNETLEILGKPVN